MVTKSKKSGTKSKLSEMIGVYRVELRPEANAADFEKLMESEVLENTITFRDGHSSQDELYVHKGGAGGDNSYIWIISRTPSIGDIGFAHNSDASTAFESLKGKVEQFGDVRPL